MTEGQLVRAARIEALIEAEVTRAMAPYRDLDMPRDVLAELETMLRLALETHPDAQFYLHQLAPEPAVDRSDAIQKGDAPEGATERREGEK